VFVIAEHTNREEKSGGSDSPALAAAGAKVPKGETPRHATLSLYLSLRHRMKRLNLSLMNSAQSGLIGSSQRSKQVRVYKGLLYFRAVRTNNKDLVEIHAKYSWNNAGEK
jgi:hypothetical protein